MDVREALLKSQTKELKRITQEMGLTQEQMAEKLNISPRACGALMRGENLISLCVFLRIWAVFDTEYGTALLTVYVNTMRQYIIADAA